MKFHSVDRRMTGDTLLRRVQLTQKYLLDVFVEVCEKYELRYFLMWGTLLGAIRHGGFIPWDDDLDVGMPIDDYKKFLAIAPKVLPKGLILQTPKLVPGCYEAFAKIRDCRSFFCEGMTDVRRPCGIFMDIFPFDRFPRVPARFRVILSKSLVRCWREAWQWRTRANASAWVMPISFFCALFWSVAGIVVRLLICIMRMIMPSVWHEAAYTGGSAGIYDDELFPLRPHEFEQGEYMIPAKPESILSRHYGNWREPPKNTSRHQIGVVFVDRAPDVWWAVNDTRS